MGESAIALGGWPAFWGAMLVGVVVAQLMPRGIGLRWFVFWMLWCGFTPVRPWYIDVPMMLTCWFLLDGIWMRLIGRKVVRIERH